MRKCGRRAGGTPPLSDVGAWPTYLAAVPNTDCAMRTRGAGLRAAFGHLGASTRETETSQAHAAVRRVGTGRAFLTVRLFGILPRHEICSRFARDAPLAIGGHDAAGAAFDCVRDAK